MGVFNVHEAKPRFSRRLNRVAQGEEPRKPGRLRGRIRIGPDFDEPLPEEILVVLRGEGKCPAITTIPSIAC